MALLKWGDDGKLWGADPDFLWGAAGDMDAADVPAIWFHALVKVDLAAPAGTQRMWTGHETLSFEENGVVNDWAGGGRTLEVTGVASSTGPGADRVRLTLNALSDTYRDQWLEPVGARPVEIRLIASEDYGLSWTILPKAKRGVLSGPVYSDGVYQVDVVHPYEVREGHPPLVWSNENQQARHPGDTGLSFMRLMASGIEAKWPHL